MKYNKTCKPHFKRRVSLQKKKKKKKKNQCQPHHLQSMTDTRDYLTSKGGGY